MDGMEVEGNYISLNSKIMSGHVEMVNTDFTAKEPNQSCFGW